MFDSQHHFWLTGECAAGSLRICESGPDVEVYSPELSSEPVVLFVETNKLPDNHARSLQELNTKLTHWIQTVYQ
jgi:hypothetical protein